MKYSQGQLDWAHPTMLKHLTTEYTYAIFPRDPAWGEGCADDSEQASNSWRPGCMGGGEKLPQCRYYGRGDVKMYVEAKC